MGLLFQDEEEAPRPAPPAVTPRGKGKATARQLVPNPYAPSSSESDEELEPELEEVAAVRRGLVRPQTQRAPQSERAKKGWLAHHSVFPSSSSSSSDEDAQSEKETESDTEDERSRMMGQSRRKPRARSRAEDREDEEGYDLSASELYAANLPDLGQDDRTDLEEPLLGPEELERRGGTKVSIPNRLQVYHGRFGHWEREGLRKYKGKPASRKSDE